MTPEKTPQKMLVILIGSQKGLCGSFNLNLFKLCEHCMKDIPQFQGHDEFIGVGKKAVEFLKKGNLHSIVQTFEKFGPKNLAQIAQEITNSILTASSAYTDVVILSNEFKSFFNQKPLSFTLLPFQKSDSIPDIPIQEDMIWEQSPHDLLDALVPQYLEALIHFKLFESLLAEHAARFVSMETATQNADGLLDAAKLQYNKLRQAKITRELSELSGNFE